MVYIGRFSFDKESIDESRNGELYHGYFYYSYGSKEY